MWSIWLSFSDRRTESSALVTTSNHYKWCHQLIISLVSQNSSDLAEERCRQLLAVCLSHTSRYCHFWWESCPLIDCLCGPIAAAICMDFNHETKRLFVGLDNGSVSEFSVADDYNRIVHQRNYLAHQNRVTAVVFSLLTEWVLSAGRDKYFVWHCSESGRRLGGYLCNSWVTALQWVFFR